MIYVAARDLIFHQAGDQVVVAAGARLDYAPDESLTDTEMDQLQRLRRARRKFGEHDVVVLAFRIQDRPRWLRVPAEARPVAEPAGPDTGPGRGGRTVRR